MRIRKSKYKLFTKELEMVVEPFWTARLFNSPLRLYITSDGDIYYCELTPDFSLFRINEKDDIIYLGEMELQNDL